jgi:hypothetical protein
MKHLNIKKLMAVGAMACVIATSCSKLEDFGSTNDNPNATTTPIISALLTNVESGIAGYASQTRGGLYCQFFSETQYTDVSLYSLPQINMDGEYAGTLYDLQNIINTKQVNNMSQVSRILKSYIFWTMTDRFGDIPYTEALSGNPTPKYDDQKVVYEGIIAELKDAVAKMDGSPISGDIIFNGDVPSWKRAANSMRLLAALRLSKKFPSASGYAATEFKAALADAGGIIDNNSFNMIVRYPGGIFRSPWFAMYDGRRDFGTSAPFVSLLGGFGDSRVTAMASSTVGVPYGRVRAFMEAWTGANANWARILNPALRNENGSVTMITAAQVLLARAEAADRGWTTENASTMFQNGVNASFAQWGVAAPSASYFTQADVAFTAAPGTGANLKPIALQRYIATYPDGLQGWSEWRRTGFPVLTPAVDATNSSKQIPRRYTYGSNEYGTNPDVVKAKAAAMPGGDTQDAKVWWDQ